MKFRIASLIFTMSLATVGHAVETQPIENLAQSVKGLKLSNGTIFKQAVELVVHGQIVDQFELPAHGQSEIFLECRGPGAPSDTEITVRYGDDEWVGLVNTPVGKSAERGLWISSQRVGRRGLETSVRQVVPGIKIRHLSIFEAPKTTMDFHSIDKVFISAGDLGRLSDKQFEALRHSVEMGMLVIISSRDAGERAATRLSTFGLSEFGDWQAVPKSLVIALPDITKVLPLNLSGASMKRLEADGTTIVGDRRIGLGTVRFVGLPLSSIRSEMLTQTVFSAPSHSIQPSQSWLEAQGPRGKTGAYLSLWVLVIPLGCCLLLVTGHRYRWFALIGCFATCMVALSLPVVSAPLVATNLWAIVPQLSEESGALVRMDFDHRLGSGRSLKIESRGVVLRSVRGANACMLYRGESATLIFPELATRTTRVVLNALWHAGDDFELELTDEKLPKYPIDGDSNRALSRVNTEQGLLSIPVDDAKIMTFRDEGARAKR